MPTKCYNVIIAGGKGTRFWPLSRARRPKQVLKILSRKSLIAETADRASALADRDHTLVVTLADQLATLRKELPTLPRTAFLAEPQGKNTAPCIGLAALEIIRKDPQAVMVVLPADHWITDAEGFRRTIRSAVGLAASSNRLVTIGIRPNYAETGFGYILKSRPYKSTVKGAFKVKGFTEKPTLKVAARLLKQQALWNSGIFVWKAARLLELLSQYQPQVAEGIASIAKAAATQSLAQPNAKLKNIVTRQYRRMPSVSIDYAVMERAAADGQVLTVEANFDWSDVGSWAAIHRMMPKNSDGNAGNGPWLALKTNDSLIHASDRLVVLLGMKNTVVVDTPDALFVADLERSQDVRELVDHLNAARYRKFTE